jgi:hypothetical protein
VRRLVGDLVEPIDRADHPCDRNHEYRHSRN